MPVKSDLQLDASKFAPKAISQATHDFNEQLIKIMDGAPKWYEVGAEKYRQMRFNGETPLPKPELLDSARKGSIPSRDKGRDIPTRVFAPRSGGVKGVMMHIHGGGWVLQTEEYQDGLLQDIATGCNLVVVSVGYRLAPEDPFPAGPNDCFDAAEYLVDNAEKQFGSHLAFIGGESAGGHLSLLAALHLLKTRRSFGLKGLVLNFGAFDLSGFLPAAHHFDKLLILDRDIMSKYIDAFVPNTTLHRRRDPDISPFYTNLEKLRGKLPPAIFTVGTEDCLMDDSVMMAAKYQMAGADTCLKIYPGAPHGFILFAENLSEGSKEGRADVKTWINERM